MKMTGVWFNELGSKMVIAKQGKNPRLLKGTYHTAVGTAKQRDYLLAGTCDAAGGESQSVGWVVAYDPMDPPARGKPKKNPDVCAWSGQLQTVNTQNGPMEYITATWVLTGATERAADWESTLIGKDYFFRTKPTAEMIGLAILP